jgi:hypothetical protein
MIYGPGINASSKSDRTIPQNSARGAYRWRATKDGRMVGFRIVYRTDNSNAGYSAGDWGRYRFRLYPDDRSSDHFPDERRRPLAELTVSPRNLGLDRSDSSIRTHRWPRPPRIVRGRRYHIVIDNVHPRKASNYLSFNQLYITGFSDRRVMQYRNADLAWLGSSGGSNWRNDGNHIPVLDVIYANGTHDGFSYVSVGGPRWRSIGGQNRVRERFTVRGRTKIIDGLGAVVQRTGGSGPLRLSIVDRSGRVLASVEVRGGSSRYSRLAGRIPRTRLLRGRVYSLVLSAPSGTSFRTHAILSADSSDDDGRHRMKSFAFRSGRGEYSTDGGSRWSPMYSGYHANSMTWMEWG